MIKRLITACMILLAAILLSLGTDFSKLTDTVHGQAPGSGKSSLSPADRRFALEAAHSGMAEVDLGILAAERAASPEVKQFAQRMIDDHTRAGDELKALASIKSLTLPASAGVPEASGGPAASPRIPSNATPQSGTPTGNSRANAPATRPSPGAAPAPRDTETSEMAKRHQALKRKLSSLSGAAFDREYMSQMVKDHTAAAVLFQSQATSGTDADLKNWAAKTLPTIQEHLRMAREVSAKVGSK